MRQGLWAVIVIALVHSAAALVGASLRAPTPTPLMPAASGALETLGVQFHRVGASRFLPVYGELLAALDPDTTVQVVVADDEDEAMFMAAWEDWFPDGDGPALRFAHTDRPITSWMRDRLAVLRDADDTILLAPRRPMEGPRTRSHDWTVPWTLGDALDLTVRVPDFHFEGGDLIADDERIYIAAPLLGRNPSMTSAEVVAAVEVATGMDALLLDGRVPNHHIGMFVTPLGDGRVAVGDPDLALSVWDPGEAPMVGGLPLPLDRSEARLERFRNVIDQLEDAGVEVVRLPLLPATQDYVFLSYNNVMLETRDDGALHVYLPIYGVPLDDAAIDVWTQQGAVVHPIDVTSIFRLGGSVRCLTAPIARR